MTTPILSRTGAVPDNLETRPPHEETTDTVETIVRIRPSRGLVGINLPELWRYRDLLLTLAMRDIKLRYRQTILGVIWVVLQPLLAAGIFSVVFGRIAKLPTDGVPPFLFSFAGLLAWNAFSGTLMKASTSLLGNSHLVTKVYFPRLILPLSTVVSVLLDFTVAFGLMAVLLVRYGVWPHAGFLLLPVWLFLLLLLGVGFGLITSSLSATYRDIQYVLPVFMQFALYGSPVAYAVSVVPDNLRVWYLLNPVTGLLEAFRWSLLGTDSLRIGYVLYSAIFAVLVFLAGVVVFRRMERKFADVI